jgi:succinylglutamate desuccinylase
MRIERRGEGEPEVAVVGGIHGDEPCGPAAVERTLAADLEYERPVVFVVANEEAIAEEVRYLEEDLNRAFPGDPDGDTHESRLAAELGDLLAGCETLSLHSTQSYERAFAIVKEIDDFARGVCPRLSVDAVVDAGGFDRGRLFTVVPQTIEVECGFQGSVQAADNATQIVREFLAATGAIDEDPISPATELPVYELQRSISKAQAAAEYEVFASNFERVEEGESFAIAGDERFTAAEPFYPVLMSAYGYDELFGFAASYHGTIP